MPNRIQATLGVVHATTWIIVLWLVDFVAQGSEAHAAYGLICAWWASLYLALLLGTNWRALFTLCGALSLALALDVAMSAKLMYHDPPDVLSIGFIGLALLQSVFWASPILVNRFVRALRNKFWPETA